MQKYHYYTRISLLYKNSPGLCPGRIRSSISTVASTIVSTPSFYLCFSFQQTFCNNSSIRSAFLHKIWVQSIFSTKISNSASTAARITVSCLYSAHARRRLQGPPGMGIGTDLSLEGHLFLKYFLVPLFLDFRMLLVTFRMLFESLFGSFPKEGKFGEIVTPLTRFACFRMFRGVISDPFSHSISRTVCGDQKTPKSAETNLPKVSKRVRGFPGWRLLWHLWRPSLFFYTKSASKVLQKWPQGGKIDSKSCPKCSKSDPKVANWTPERGPKW